MVASSQECRDEVSPCLTFFLFEAASANGCFPTAWCGVAAADVLTSKGRPCEWASAKSRVLEGLNTGQRRDNNGGGGEKGKTGREGWLVRGVEFAQRNKRIV